MGNMLSFSGFANRLKNGKIKLSGIDMGGQGVILAENEEFMAVKWPGSTYWTGINMGREYSPAEVVVYRKSMKEDFIDGQAYEFLTPLIEYNVRQKKGNKEKSNEGSNYEESTHKVPARHV